MSNFSLLLDELYRHHVQRDIDEPGWQETAPQRVRDREAAEMRKAQTPAFQVETKPAKPSIDDLIKAITASGDVIRKLNAETAKRKAKDAADQKAREDAMIADRNARRAGVSNVLAKALELNRLGEISATDVARIEISAHETLRRIG